MAELVSGSLYNIIASFDGTGSGTVEADASPLDTPDPIVRSSGGHTV